MNITVSEEKGEDEMKVTYVENNTKLIVESNEVADVIKVLSLFAKHPEATQMEVVVKEPVLKNTTPVRNITEPVILETKYQNKHIITDTETKPKLIFYKCKKCGSVSFHFGNVDDTITCFHCKDSRTLDPLHKGSYECECGATCTFLVEDSVSEISCRNKECDKKFLMLWDSATDSYVGGVEY